MQFVELGSFDVVRQELAWPWIAIDVGRSRVAFLVAGDKIATRVLEGGRLVEGASFALPRDLILPRKKAPAEKSAAEKTPAEKSSTGKTPADKAVAEKAAAASHRGAEEGVHGFSIAKDGALVAVVGTVGESSGGASVVVTLGADGEMKRSRIDALAGGDFVGHAVAFDRSGTRLWISAESEKETALILLDARTHSAFGAVKSAAFPPPSFHELHLHAQDDAVLLLAACGQDGTFARICGWSDGPPLAIPTALDGGSVAAGFVGFSADGARVHLAEADELRTHAWPGLELLSSVDLADDFVSSYVGVVLGDRIFVDGEDRDTGDEDAVMLFDRAAIRGKVQHPPVPGGMWVGRLGADAIVTVDSKRDPARAHVVQLPPPKN